MTRRATTTCVALLAALWIGPNPALSAPDEPPPGVEEILPRGGIPAVFDPVFASTDAWLLPDGVDATGDGLLERLEAGELAGAEPLGGFDTYWYTWVAQNEDTKLLR